MLVSLKVPSGLNFLHCSFEPRAVNEHSRVLSYLDRFESLPGVADYLASDRFDAFPVNDPGRPHTAVVMGPMNLP